ncbi:hypothetical protein [Roseiflexus sp.]|uniref:hypothetical protein n=2 Tax=Roseiflexus sp. TaxID=2562120 RepID=UPI00398A60F3
MYTSQEIDLAGATLFFRYPQTFRFDATGADSFPLIAWVEQNTGSTGPVTVTVELSSSAILFTDTNGRALTSRLAMTVGSESPPQQARIQPLLPNPGAPSAIDVLISDTTGQTINRQLTINQETQSEFYWRIFVHRFFGDAGLALAVASAVFGIGWQLLNEGRQTRTSQQLDRVRELNDLFERDLVEWTLTSQTLEQEAKRGWEEQARQELRRTRERRNDQLGTPEVQERINHLLDKAAHYYREGDSKRWNAILDLVVQAYHHSDLRNMPRPLPDARTADRQSAEAILHICRFLLHHFPTDAHKLVVVVIEMLAARSDNRTVIECVLQAIRQPGDEPGANTLSKLVTNDPQIRRRLIDDLPWTYEWSQITVTPTMSARTQAETDWLETHRLGIHPFKPRELQNQHEFLERVTLPEMQREAIIQKRPFVVVTGSQFDCSCAAAALYNELRNPTTQQMPIRVVLTDQYAASHHDVLLSLAREVGRIWLELLCTQPGVLLWLTEDDQIVLTEWLVWINGSPRVLRQRLRRAGWSHDMLRRLDHALARIEAPDRPLSTSLLCTWLTIRPPEVTDVRPIIVDQTSDVCAGMIVEPLSAMREAGVTPNVFTLPTRRGIFEHVQSIALEWSEKELLDLLDTAVAGAGGHGQRLVDLVEMDDPALDDEAFLLETLKYARGSFERSLAIFRRALDHHLTRHRDRSDPRYLFLNEHDIIAALLDT